MAAAFRTLFFCIAAPLALAGCAALGALGSASRPLDAYQLSASSYGPVARGAPRAEHVIVDVPTAGAAINTDGILIRPQPNQLQYLADARWIEDTPLMLQSALVDGLERTGAFRFVGRRPLGPAGDYALVANIAEFHAEVLDDGQGAAISLRITLRMVREEDAQIVASEVFRATAVAADTETATIVDAYDLAATQAIDGIIAWVLKTRGIRTVTPGAT